MDYQIIFLITNFLDFLLFTSAGRIGGLIRFRFNQPFAASKQRSHNQTASPPPPPPLLLLLLLSLSFLRHPNLLLHKKE